MVDPFVLTYAQACFATWATPEVCIIAARVYLPRVHESISPTRACRKVEEAERAFLAAEPHARGGASRRLLHAKARWYASLITATHDQPHLQYGDMPGRQPVRPPLILKRDLDAANARAERRRFLRQLEAHKTVLQSMLTKRADALAAAERALVAYRAAVYQREKALTTARRTNPHANTPREYVEAADVAKATLDQARGERSALRAAVRTQQIAIRVLRKRHRDRWPEDSVLNRL